MSGSQGKGAEATRRERLVQTTDKFDGRLKESKKKKIYVTSNFCLVLSQEFFMICLVWIENKFKFKFSFSF